MPPALRQASGVKQRQGQVSGQAPLERQDLEEPGLDHLDLVVTRQGAGPSGQAAVPAEHLQGGLHAREARLDGDPVGLGDDGLEAPGLVELARPVQLADAHAGARHQVGGAGDGAVAADDEPLQDEVGAAARDEEAGLGVGRDARQLARVAAGELYPFHVVVPGDGEDRVRREVQPRARPRVVVDDERDRARVRDVVEVRGDLGCVEEPAVVRRRQHDGRVGACCRCVPAQLDALSGRLGAASRDHGHQVVVCLVESSPRRLDDLDALLPAQVDCLAIGAVDYEASYSGLG